MASESIKRAMSAARERAGRALWETRLSETQQSLTWEDRPEKWREANRKESDIAHRASLDENDAALVEAMAIGMVGAAWYHNDPEGSQNSARRAIIAARNHITGDTP